MPVATPIRNPRAWDSVIVAGQQSPGWCIVGEFERHHVIDSKDAGGSSGATQTIVKRPPVKGKIEFHLLDGPKWNDPPQVWTHLNDWLVFSKLFKYDPSKASLTAVTLYHPALAFIDATSFLCESLTNPVQVEIGHYRVVVSLVEFFPAAATGTSTASLSKAKAPAPNAPPGTPPDPAVVALQKQIAAQLATANGLANIPPNAP